MSRFERRRQLGSGGMGVVYEALDRDHDTLVALKTVRVASPEALQRFKREFRLLQSVSHRNLVRLFELVEERGEWLLAMELVRGVDFLTYVCGAGEQARDDATVTAVGKREGSVQARQRHAFDEARLRAVLPQIAAGLSALHRAHRLHKDVKPSNVMIAEDGRVVIVDFGLVADLRERADDGAIAGTMRYMAPEQIVSEDVGPAADWYALGAMVFEALTGRPPFVGTLTAVAQAKRTSAAPRASSLADGVPADLDALCAALLERDPAARATGEALVQERGTLAQADVFIGRSEELETVRRAIASGEHVLVFGESGIGKSALLSRVVDERRTGGAFVLAGRCYERESVPYKAFDEVIDQLVTALEHDRAACEGLTVLCDIFPAFRRVIAGAPAPDGDPHALRARAFAALRTLLARLDATVVIDDLQWADEDSLALLATLTRPTEEGRETTPLFICGLRSGTLAPLTHFRRIDLSPLGADDAVRLAELLRPNAEDAARIARESAGHPLFIAELAAARSATVTPRLEDAIRARVATFDAAAQHLLSLLAIAGGPLPVATLHAAASLERAALTSQLVHLRAHHLVRASGPKATDHVELFHDRLRVALTERLDAAARLSAHRTLAAALEADANAPPEAVADHWRAAGEHTRANAFVLRAADDAAAALAFDRAARLYRTALAHDPSASVRERLALALQNGGRGAQAADEWLALAATSSGDARTLFESRAAEQLVQSGNIARGLVVIGRLLADMKLPFARTTTRRLVDLAVQRAAVRFSGIRYTLRDPSTIDPTATARVDALWTVGGALSMYDPFTAAPYRARHLREALKLGDAQRITRALAVEACFSCVGGTKTRARTAVVLKACATAAAQAGTAYARAHEALAAGVCAYCEGRFLDARAALLDAVALLATCAGVPWERASAEMFLVTTLELLGEWEAVGPRLHAALRDAHERGDAYAEHQLEMMRFLPLLLADQAESVLAPAPAPAKESFDVPTYNRLVSRTTAQLYLGDGAAALAELRASWKDLERTFLLHLQFARIDVLRVRAGGALLVAARGLERKQHLAIAARDAKRISAEGAAWGDGISASIRAGVAHLEGNRTLALACLDDAAKGYDAAAMRLYALSARRARGLLANDASAVDASEAAMRARGLANPARIARLHLAGVFE